MSARGAGARCARRGRLPWCVAYLAAGGGDYEPTAVADPCAPREWRSPAGIEESAQQFALSALDGAACELGVSREALAVALATPGVARASSPPSRGSTTPSSRRRYGPGSCGRSTTPRRAGALRPAGRRRPAALASRLPSTRRSALIEDAGDALRRTPAASIDDLGGLLDRPGPAALASAARSPARPTSIDQRLQRQPRPQQPARDPVGGHARFATCVRVAPPCGGSRGRPQPAAPAATSGRTAGRARDHREPADDLGDAATSTASLGRIGMYGGIDRLVLAGRTKCIVPAKAEERGEQLLRAGHRADRFRFATAACAAATARGERRVGCEDERGLAAGAARARRRRRRPPRSRSPAASPPSPSSTYSLAARSNSAASRRESHASRATSTQLRAARVLAVAGRDLAPPELVAVAAPAGGRAVRGLGLGAQLAAGATVGSSPSTPRSARRQPRVAQRRRPRSRTASGRSSRDVLARVQDLLGASPADATRARSRPASSCRRGRAARRRTAGRRCRSRVSWSTSTSGTVAGARRRSSRRRREQVERVQVADRVVDHHRGRRALDQRLARRARRRRRGAAAVGGGRSAGPRARGRARGRARTRPAPGSPRPRRRPRRGGRGGGRRPRRRGRRSTP